MKCSIMLSALFAKIKTEIHHNLELPPVTSLKYIMGNSIFACIGKLRYFFSISAFPSFRTSFRNTIKCQTAIGLICEKNCLQRLSADIQVLIQPRTKSEVAAPWAFLGIILYPCHDACLLLSADFFFKINFFKKFFSKKNIKGSNSLYSDQDRPTESQS